MTDSKIAIDFTADPANFQDYLTNVWTSASGYVTFPASASITFPPNTSWAAGTLPISSLGTAPPYSYYQQNYQLRDNVTTDHSRLGFLARLGLVWEQHPDWRLQDLLHTGAPLPGLSDEEFLTALEANFPE